MGKAGDGRWGVTLWGPETVDGMAPGPGGLRERADLGDGAHHRRWRVASAMGKADDGRWGVTPWGLEKVAREGLAFGLG